MSGTFLEQLNIYSATMSTTTHQLEKYMLDFTNESNYMPKCHSVVS